jgi:hypothetical protein
LPELRLAAGEPDFCRHVEVVVLDAPDAEAILSRRRTAAIDVAKAGANSSAQAGSGSLQLTKDR